MSNNTLTLKKGVTFRYVMALSIVALLSTVAFFTLTAAIKSTKSTAYIVNISGKQRMLSQHIALDVSRIYESIKSDKQISTYNGNLVRETLTQHANEMLQVNKILSSGKLPDQTTISLSPTIHEFYFGEMNLEARVQNYAKSALSFLTTQNHNTDLNKLKQMIDTQSEPLLVDLNKAVTQYQFEGEQRLQNLKNLEMIVWIITFFTLLLEVIFIFQPMVRQIVMLSLTNEQVLENLENTIELRTLHLESTNNKLKYAASHDTLTGLRNRLELESSIEKAILQYKNNHSPYALLMLDIDWFKQVNDTYGHDIGDKVLIELSSIISASVREEDKVFRAGGEEFVVLLNRISFEESQHLAEKLRLLSQKHIFRVDDEEFSKTISLGLFHSSVLEVNTIHEVMKLIDMAMYESKTNGRNRVTVVHKDMDRQIVKTYDSKITIVFADRTLNTILELDRDLLCIDINTHKLASNTKTFASIVHEDDLYILETMPTNIAQERPFSTTLRVMDENEKIYICRVKMYENSNKNIVISFSDATQLAEQISDATLIRNLHSMLENTNDYIYFKDINHVFTAASKTLVSVTSVNSRDEFVGKTDYDVFPKELADEYFKLERAVFNNEVNVAQKLQPTLDKDGNRAWVDNRKYPIYDENETIIGLFGIARVISDYEYKNFPQSIYNLNV